MSRENSCICGKEFPSSLGLWQHKTVCGQPDRCSVCDLKRGTEKGAYGDWYCDACFKLVTTEGEP
jgi:hypothetical protein